MVLPSKHPGVNINVAVLKHIVFILNLFSWSGPVCSSDVVITDRSAECISAVSGAFA